MLSTSLSIVAGPDIWMCLPTENAVTFSVIIIVAGENLQLYIRATLPSTVKSHIFVLYLISYFWKKCKI